MNLLASSQVGETRFFLNTQASVAEKAELTQLKGNHAGLLVRLACGFKGSLLA